MKIPSLAAITALQAAQRFDASMPRVREKTEFTEFDQQRIDAAIEKRARKSAKRVT